MDTEAVLAEAKNYLGLCEGLSLEEYDILHGDIEFAQIGIYKMQEAYNAAIEYTLARSESGERFSAEDALYFLMLWHEGAWDEIETAFPSFDLSSAESFGYIRREEK